VANFEQPICFNDNGGWCWFQDPRAVVDTQTNQLLISSIAHGSGAGGRDRHGNLEVTAFDLHTRASSRFVLAQLNADDHNAAALLIRPDGRYLAVYSNHGTDPFTRYRITSHYGDATRWQPERTFDNGIGATYANLFRVADDRLIYNFTRTHGYDPNFLVSRDDGETWRYGGHLLKDPADSPRGRPYLKYASNGVSRIYFVTTEDHPNANDNGLYAGYLERGKLYHMDGAAVAPPGAHPAARGPSAAQFTPILLPDTIISGQPRTHAWPCDLVLDASGQPRTIFTSRVSGDPNDHRFHYARWTGNRWEVHELARAGGYLYAGEEDYTGLAAIDPDDTNTVFLSSNIDPATRGAALRHYEIFRGITRDGGASWTWNPLTTDSPADNIRPLVPSWPGPNRVILWLRGDYTSYTDYNVKVVGIIEPHTFHVPSRTQLLSSNRDPN
jgi:hypothetical protein